MYAYTCVYMCTCVCLSLTLSLSVSTGICLSTNFESYRRLKQTSDDGEEGGMAGCGTQKKRKMQTRRERGRAPVDVLLGDVHLRNSWIMSRILR